MSKPVIRNLTKQVKAIQTFSKRELSKLTAIAALIKSKSDQQVKDLQAAIAALSGEEQPAAKAAPKAASSNGKAKPPVAEKKKSSKVETRRTSKTTGDDVRKNGASDTKAKKLKPSVAPAPSALKSKKAKGLIDKAEGDAGSIKEKSTGIKKKLVKKSGLRSPIAAR